MIVNSFVINTVDFLNKLNAVSEHKLRQVQQHIQRVEITLALLEGKLDSVSWLSQSSLHTRQHACYPLSDTQQAQWLIPDRAPVNVIIHVQLATCHHPLQPPPAPHPPTPATPSRPPLASTPPPPLRRHRPPPRLPRPSLCFF